MRLQLPPNVSFSHRLSRPLRTPSPTSRSPPCTKNLLRNASAPPFLPTRSPDCSNNSNCQNRQPSDSFFGTIGPQHSMPTRVHENPQSPLGTIIDSATQQFVPCTSTPQRSLRQSTMNLRKANLLYKACLPRDLTDFLSPKKTKHASRNNPDS